MPEPGSAGTSLATEGAESAAGNDAASAQGIQAQTTEPILPEWVKSLEGLDVKDRGKLARFKSQNELAKSYLEAERKIGASVTIPGKDAKPEEVGAFYQRLGRPESPGGYELDPVFLPDGVTKADMGEEAFKQAAFQIGLSKDQAKALHKWAVTSSLDMIAGIRRQNEQARTAARDVLKKEYGLEYDKKLALVAKVNRKFGDDDWIKYLNQGAGNEPALLRTLIRIGEAISEETLETGGVVKREVPAREPGVFSYPKRPEITGTNRVRRVATPK